MAWTREPLALHLWKMSASRGLGCICAELFLGLPVFPGHSEYDQVNRLAEEEEKLDLRKGPESLGAVIF